MSEYSLPSEILAELEATFHELPLPHAEQSFEEKNDLMKMHREQFLQQLRANAEQQGFGSDTKYAIAQYQDAVAHMIRALSQAPDSKATLLNELTQFIDTDMTEMKSFFLQNNVQIEKSEDEIAIREWLMVEKIRFDSPEEYIDNIIEVYNTGSIEIVSESFANKYRQNYEVELVARAQGFIYDAHNREHRRKDAREIGRSAVAAAKCTGETASVVAAAAVLFPVIGAAYLAGKVSSKFKRR